MIRVYPFTFPLRWNLGTWHWTFLIIMPALTHSFAPVILNTMTLKDIFSGGIILLISCDFLYKCFFPFPLPDSKPYIHSCCIGDEECVLRNRNVLTACGIDFLPAVLLIMCPRMRQLSKRSKIKASPRKCELGIRRTQETIDELLTVLPSPQQQSWKSPFFQIYCSSKTYLYI